jgi:hypothetical protein
MNPLYDANDLSLWTAVAVRAPDSAWDGKRYLGSELGAIDESAAIASGLKYSLIRDGRFCAVAAPSREDA